MPADLTRPATSEYHSPLATQMALQTVREMGNELEKMVAILRTRDVDQRWLSIGNTHFQEGIMAVMRSINKPEHF